MPQLDESDRREIFRRLEECEKRDFQAIGRIVNGGKTPTNNNGWSFYFGVAALIFGLMTPMYMMNEGLKRELVGIKKRASIDEAHMTDQKETTGRISERFKEIETQFRGMGDRIEMAHRFQDKLIEENRQWRERHQKDAYQVVFDLGKIDERVKVLERKSQ